MSVEVAMLLVWLVGLPLAFISFVIIYPRYLRWRVSSSSRSRVLARGASSLVGADSRAKRSRVRPYRDI